MPSKREIPDEYLALVNVFEDAARQAAFGKGKARHAEEGEAYEDQIICEVARRVGLGYPLGQAAKKIYESQRIGGERGVAELLGAINYIAAAVIVMREGMENAIKAEAEEVEKAFGKPDGGCCQNGKVHWPEEPEFKQGDAVELWDKARDKWMPCVYLRKAVDPGYSIVQSSDCRELLVSSFYLRKAEANHPENPDSSKCAEGCEELVQRIKEVNPAIYGEKEQN